ncbi:hypothetical protein HanPSC8_Chr05g0216981 [Helianthus annuus]|nr:hypothetical protein HanPSC8_Chr05g0216981 [Helianthus annuus]
MDFQVAEEILLENLEAPVNEIWYQDIKEIPCYQLPESQCRDKPVYVEDKTNVALYVVAYQRENGKMTTVQLYASEKPWYHQIVKNFALPKDEDLQAQPAAGVGELIYFGVGLESKKKKCATAATVAPKKADMPKADESKAEKKKGTRLVSDSCCDYIVVSDSLERLAAVAVKKPKAEPKDTADHPRIEPRRSN